MKNILAVLTLAFLLAACGGKTTDKAPGDKGKPGTETASTGETKHKFGIKSGILEMKNSMMKDMKQTMYFDEYGEKQAVFTTMEMAGTKIENVQITAGGYMTTYDTQKKTGKRVKQAGAANGIPGLSDLNDSMKKEFKLQDIEGMEIAGKQCKGYSMEVMGMKVKVWAYENVPFCMEMAMGKEPMRFEATSYQENADVPADKFTVPADIKIEEENAAAAAPPAGGSTAAPEADTAKH